MSSPLISVVTCFLNESDTIDLYLTRIVPILEKATQGSYEIVCVDDGSQDDTLKKLQSYNNKDARIRVIELSRNFGKEAALTAGIDYAKGAAVIPIDADLQDPPELIPEMINVWQNGVDVVLARRINRHSDTLAKRHSANLFYKIYNKLSPISLPENVGDFRLLDRRVVDALKTLPERQRFMKGIFAWVGFKTETVDYIRPERSAGSSKFSAWRLWNLALEGLTSFSSMPLRIWTYIGLTGAALSTLYAAFIIARTLILGIDVPGYASLLVAVLFMGSLQLLSVGLIGEYIGRLYIETKQRTIYIVRSTLNNCTDRREAKSIASLNDAAYAQMAAVEHVNWWFAGRRAIAERVISHLGLTGKVHNFEAGCGTEGNLELLSTFGTVCAFETNADARAIALCKSTGIRIEPGLLPDEIPFGDRQFDLICMMDVLERVAKDVGALEKLAVRLKPGGKLLLTVPAYPFLWSQHDEFIHHHRRYTKETLIKTLNASGLRAAWTSYFNALLFPLAAISRLTARSKRSKPGGDKLPTPFINNILRATLSAERHLVCPRTLPFGVSLIAVAEL